MSRRYASFAFDSAATGRNRSGRAENGKRPVRYYCLAPEPSRQPACGHVPHGGSQSPRCSARPTRDAARRSGAMEPGDPDVFPAHRMAVAGRSRLGARSVPRGVPVKNTNDREVPDDGQRNLGAPLGECIEPDLWPRAHVSAALNGSIRRSESIHSSVRHRRVTRPLRSSSPDAVVSCDGALRRVVLRHEPGPGAIRGP